MILISLVAIIGVIAFLVSRQTEQRGAVEFFAAADESSATHSRASMELESALGSIGVVDRQDLTRRLDSVSAAAAEADAFLDLDVPPRLGGSYGTMSTASSSWKVGTADLSTAITAVMDGDSVEKAQEQLQGALDLLRVGDVSYSLFLASLAEVPRDTEIPDFSGVVYINPDAQDPLLYDAQSLVLRILSSYALSPHHDVAVTGMTKPEPVGERGGLPVVPFAESLDIQAVVSNIGNEDEATVRVKLDIFDLDADSAVTELQTITDLVAGSSTTVTFSNVDVSPGGLYQTTVTVTIPEDINADNNVWDMTFIWRNES